MSEIKIYAISKDEAEKTAALLLPDAAEALSEGLPVTAFAAVEDDTAIGAVAGVINDGIFDITSLFVDPEHRRRGAGRALIRRLDELLADEDTGMMVRYTLQSADNESLLPFFSALGFRETPLSYPAFFMGQVADLKEESSVKDREDKSIHSFDEVQDTVLRTASNKSFKEGLPLPEDGLLAGSVDREISFCVMKEGKIMAYVTAEDRGDDLLEISSLWSGLDNPVELLVMLQRLISAITAKYPPDTRIMMLATNETVYRLIDRLFYNVEPCSYRLIRM